MTAVEAKRRWRGPVVPVLTIFRDDLSLDLDGLRSNVRYLLDQGARVGNTVLLVCGAGGDFPVLTTEERKQVAETVADEARDRVPIIVGIEHTSTLTCVELAQHAARLGADAVQICPPYYYTPSPEDVFHHFRIISDAAEIGIVVYNTFWTAPNIGLENMAQLLSLKNVIAIKWKAPTESECAEGYDRFVRQAAMIANTTDFVSTHKRGAVGWISHVSNFWPQHDWRILELMEAGKYGEAQKRIDNFNIAFGEFRAAMEAQTGGEGHAIKQIMELVGLTGGPSRPPTRHVRMTERQREDLTVLLEERVNRLQ